MLYSKLLSLWEIGPRVRNEEIKRLLKPLGVEGGDRSEGTHTFLRRVLIMNSRAR